VSVITIKTCIKCVDEKPPVMRPNLQPKITNLPLRRVGREEISPIALPRG
jgi:hypothetical protein